MTSRRESSYGLPLMLTPSSIQMFPAGSNVYLGLCVSRVAPHAICVGETLFVFLHASLSLAEIVQQVQDVVADLPADIAWKPDPQNALRLDWIAQQLAAREEEMLEAPSPRGNVVVRKRLLPA